MKRNSLNPKAAVILTGLAAFLVFFQNCSQVDFAMMDDAALKAGQAGQTDQITTDDVLPTPDVQDQVSSDDDDSDDDTYVPPTNTTTTSNDDDDDDDYMPPTTTTTNTTTTSNDDDDDDDYMPPTTTTTTTSNDDDDDDDDVDYKSSAACGCPTLTGAKIYVELASIEFGNGKKSTSKPGPGLVEISQLDAQVNLALAGSNSDKIRVVLGGGSHVKCADGSMHNLETPSALSSGLKVNQGNSVDNALGAMGININVDGVAVNLHETGNGKCKMHPHISVQIGDAQSLAIN